MLSLQRDRGLGRWLWQGLCCRSLSDQLPLVCCRLWSTMGLDLQPDLCSLLIDDVIYHEAAVRQAGAEALSQAVARYQRQAAEVMAGSWRSTRRSSM